MEAVVLNAMMTGSSMLNLRAHFLSRLPDLSGLAGMLTHLNLSFNDLWVSEVIVRSFVNFSIRQQASDFNQSRLQLFVINFSRTFNWKSR